jgi:glutathione S-transferase
VVTEAAAICAYLADMFPDKGLAPPSGNKRRGDYYRWMFFAAGPLEAAVTGKALGLLVPPDKAGMAGYGTFEDVLNTLEQAVSDCEFLCGDHVTAADIYVGAQIGWGMMFGTIDKRPAFERYVGALQSRPAAARAREIDDALMPPRGGGGQ